MTSSVCGRATFGGEVPRFSNVATTVPPPLPTDRLRCRCPQQGQGGTVLEAYTRQARQAWTYKMAFGFLHGFANLALCLGDISATKKFQVSSFAASHFGIPQFLFLVRALG